MFIYSFLEHETFVKSFKKYYLLSKSELIDYTDILREDSLLSDFKDSTIIRRQSTVKAIIRWVENYLV